MSDCESYDEEMITGNIFKGNGRWIPSRKRNVSSHDVHNGTSIYYAVTVNIKPDKLINKRRWKLYSPEKQVEILRRIEGCLRRDNPSIELKDLHFETCPILKNMHFHALYMMPEVFCSTMANYYDRVIGGNDINTTVPWRHLRIDSVYDYNGWLRYIRKGI